MPSAVSEFQSPHRAGEPRPVQPFAAALRHSPHPAGRARDAVRTAAWITVQGPQDAFAVQLLRETLHAGESETIMLAKEVSAAWVLIDDLAARRKASAIGLRVVGTLGVLLMARAAEHLTAVRPLLDLLREGDFRISPDLYEEILKEAGEAP